MECPDCGVYHPNRGCDPEQEQEFKERKELAEKASKLGETGGTPVEIERLVSQPPVQKSTSRNLKCEKSGHKWEMGYGFTPGGKYFGGYTYCKECLHWLPAQVG